MLRMPYPPSVNSIWRSVNGRNIKSKPYRAWRDKAGWQVKAQKPPRIEGPFSLDIVVDRPDKRKRDISNLIKALEDVLVDTNVVEDDCHCQELTIRWSETEDGPLILIHATDRSE